MTGEKRKHIAVHINELVLPRGSRMPDHAALHRLVAAEMLRAESTPSRADAEPHEALTTGAGAIATTIASQVRRHITGDV